MPTPKPGKKAPEHLRASLERRRSSAASPHTSEPTRASLERQAIEEGIDDAQGNCCYSSHCQHFPGPEGVTGQ